VPAHPSRSACAPRRGTQSPGGTGPQSLQLRRQGLSKSSGKRAAVVVLYVCLERSTASCRLDALTGSADIGIRPSEPHSSREMKQDHVTPAASQMILRGHKRFAGARLFFERVAAGMDRANILQSLVYNSGSVARAPSPASARAPRSFLPARRAEVEPGQTQDCGPRLRSPGVYAKRMVSRERFVQHDSKEKTSERSSGALPSSTSGAMYPGVPPKVAQLWVSADSSFCGGRAKPKSRILTVPSGVIIRFSGLRIAMHHTVLVRRRNSLQALLGDAVKNSGNARGLRSFYA